MEEKEKEGVLFPKNVQNPTKFTFDFEPNNSYISFREDLHLSIIWKIKVICHKEMTDGSVESIDVTFTLKSHF